MRVRTLAKVLRRRCQRPQGNDKSTVMKFGIWGSRMKQWTLTFGLWVLAAAMMAGQAQAQEQECLLQAESPQQPPTIVKFEVDSTAIAANDHQRLVEFANRMRGNPSSIVCVVGQADKQGDDAYNEDLARRRATEVGQVLTANGVNPNRMVIAVRGEAFDDSLFSFLDPLDTDRRVEVLRWDQRLAN